LGRWGGGGGSHYCAGEDQKKRGKRGEQKREKKKKKGSEISGKKERQTTSKRGCIQSTRRKVQFYQRGQPGEGRRETVEATGRPAMGKRGIGIRKIC